MRKPHLILSAMLLLLCAAGCSSGSEFRRAERQFNEVSDDLTRQMRDILTAYTLSDEEQSARFSEELLREGAYDRMDNLSDELSHQLTLMEASCPRRYITHLTDAVRHAERINGICLALNLHGLFRRMPAELLLPILPQSDNESWE